MRDRPSGAELLDVAREVLRDKITSDLSPESRYDALMVANAMAIVMRQMEAGEQGQKDERQALSRTLGIEGDLETLNTELANRIRFGDAGNPATWKVLHDVAVAKVAESNPRYLTADE